MTNPTPLSDGVVAALKSIAVGRKALATIDALEADLATLTAERDALRTALEERGHGPDCNFYMRFHAYSGYRCDCGFDELRPGVSARFIAEEQEDDKAAREALGGNDDD